ncbi:MAG: hypothetical protein M1113_05700 [Candidatus Thermoplasmatota archaeon]|nr:hypothetical protein [Candidatus Thermoplasmatota archaeon]
MKDSKCDLLITGSRFQFVNFKPKSFEIILGHSLSFPEILEIAFISIYYGYQQRTGKAHEKMKVNQLYLFWLGYELTAILIDYEQIYCLEYVYAYTPVINRIYTRSYRNYSNLCT